jgi:predicted kinase
MPILLLTRGLPGSGKTTFARRWVAEDPDRRVRVNRDDLRAMHGLDRRQDYGAPNVEAILTAVQHSTIRVLLGGGWSVVVDDTNLRPDIVAPLVTIAEERGVAVEVHDLRAVPLEVCLRRDAGRGQAGDRYVGEDVIKAMHSRWILDGGDAS